MFFDKKRFFFPVCLLLTVILWKSPASAAAEIELTSPSAILVEASTGQVIYEKNADEKRSPASITKIMTLLLAMEQIGSGKADLKDEITVSEHAASMGGSQVFLAQGEIQTMETMLKCIAVASGNDACVAVAEFLAGSEEAFVKQMNDKAAALGMTNTHFVDCCGLTASEEHYTTARDVACMSGKLITEYPEIFQYTGIWMEDIIHETRQGSSRFTLSSTNKLLKRYPYATGLKTGSTQKAKYCISATASKDGVDMIAVVLGAPDPKTRFSEAQTLLTYGYAGCKLYLDKEPLPLPVIKIRGGVKEGVSVVYEGEFRYLDMEGLHFEEIERELVLPDQVEAPVEKGGYAGELIYRYHDAEIGKMPVIYAESVEKADFWDCLRAVLQSFLFSKVQSCDKIAK